MGLLGPPIPKHSTAHNRLRPGEQQTILGRDVPGDKRGVDVEPRPLHAGGTGGIDGEAGIHPTVETSGIVAVVGVAAGEDRDAVGSGDGQIEDLVGQGSAGVNRY